MQWVDDAIILSGRKYGENSLIITLLSRHQGMHKGMVRNNSKASHIYQPGNHVRAVWKARLSEQLGSFTLELKESCIGMVIGNPLKLTALGSITSILEKTLMEREIEENLYLALTAFLLHLKQQDNWLKNYVLLESLLLSETGFAFGLECCAASGSKENLCYVSPKSGRAVSAGAGEPYKAKLLPLPPFLRDVTHDATDKDIVNGLMLTGYFIEKHHFFPRKQNLPHHRCRLVELLNNLSSI